MQALSIRYQYLTLEALIDSSSGVGTLDLFRCRPIIHPPYKIPVLPSSKVYQPDIELLQTRVRM
jgi:hypothetical protein